MSETKTREFDSPEDVLNHYGLKRFGSEFNSPEEVLAHYGIMGMRWGQRKDDPGGPGYSDKTEGKPASELRKKTNEAAKKVADRAVTVVKVANERRFEEKDPRDFDDAELERRINRLQKEQKYRDMNSSKVDRGRVIVANVLKTAGVAAATTILTAGLIYAGKRGAFKGLSKMSKVGPQKAEELLKATFPKDKISWLNKPKS